MGCNCINKEMPSIPRGNDILITWSVSLESGASVIPFNLKGKDISIYLKSSYKVHKVKHFSISENVINLYFYGKDQISLGPYCIELVINDMNTGMFTISRHNAFELVKHSCDTEWGDYSNPVNLSPINISTILKFEIDNDMNLCITLASGDMEKLIALDDNGYLTLNS